MRVTSRASRALATTLALAVPCAGGAQERSSFMTTSAPVIALVNARVIDGTGAPARAGQTLVTARG